MQTTPRPSTADLPIPPAAPRGVFTWRSLALGALSIIFICGLTPYNDILMNSSFLVGMYLPAGLLLFFLLFLMLVNAPLHRWWPQQALSTGELSVALAMALAACGVASAGAMRYLPYGLVAPAYQSQSNFEYRQMLHDMHLPSWIFPTTPSEVSDAGNDPAIRDFVGRVPVEQDTFLAHLQAVPWMLWFRPALAWGIFLVALWGAILCLNVIVRKQWVENERLAFPLASVYLSLIESPKPGHSLSPLLRSRGFWISCGAVMFIYLLRGLSQYHPRVVPTFPIEYSLQSLFSEPPLRYCGWFFRFGKIYFCMIGIAYFIQSQIGFSLWFPMLALQVVYMILGTYSLEFGGAAETDQIFGGGVVYILLMLWIGRHHWRDVARQMFSRQTAPGEYLPLGITAWLLVASCVILCGWFVAAGTTIVGAIVLVMCALLMYLVIARIVAETGLLFVQTGVVPPTRLWVYMSALSDGAIATTPKTYFLTSLIHGTLTFDLRESPSVFTSHALRIADDATPEVRRSRGQGLLFLTVLMGALVFSYLVGGISTLYVNYSYASTQDQKQSAPLNSGSLDYFPKNQTLDPTRRYIGGPSAMADPQSRITHFSIGAGITAALSFLRMRFAGWPLHPVGYLLVYSFAIQITWLSLFLGWLAKVLLIRFGGVQLYRQARPVFLGLIVGEAGAGALWLVVSLILHALGAQFYRVDVVPY